MIRLKVGKLPGYQHNINTQHPNELQLFMINILPEFFFYFFYVIKLYQSLFGILLLLDQGNQVLERVHSYLLDFLVVF